MINKYVMAGLVLLSCGGSLDAGKDKGISVDITCTSQTADQSNIVPFLMWLGSRAIFSGAQILNAKALASSSPQSFRRYKQVAAAVESVAALLRVGYTASFLKRGEHILSVLGLLSIWRSLEGIRDDLRHSAYAEQLHMMLQTPAFKAQFYAKNWQKVATKRIQTELILQAVVLLAVYGSYYVQDEPKSHFLPLLAASLAQNFASSTIIDKDNALGVEHGFNSALLRDEQFEDYFRD